MARKKKRTPPRDSKGRFRKRKRWPARAGRDRAAGGL